MTTRSNPLTALSTDPTGRRLDLSLPSGSLVTETNDGTWREQLLWVADGTAAPGTWAQYLPVRAAAGLRPVLLQDEPRIEKWWDGELDPGMMSARGPRGHRGRRRAGPARPTAAGRRDP